MILNKTHHNGYFNYKRYTMNKIIDAVRGIVYGMSMIQNITKDIYNYFDYADIISDRPKTYDIKPLPIITKQNIKIVKPSIKNQKLQRANLLKRERR